MRGALQDRMRRKNLVKVQRAKLELKRRGLGSVSLPDIQDRAVIKERVYSRDIFEPVPIEGGGELSLVVEPPLAEPPLAEPPLIEEVLNSEEMVKPPVEVLEVKVKPKPLEFFKSVGKKKSSKKKGEVSS